jgi:taurine dioxygenase
MTTIHPLENQIGAEIRGLDLAHPLDAAGFEQVQRAYLDYGFLLVRGQQHLTHRQLTDFTGRFGELMAGYPQASGHQRENEHYFKKQVREARYEHPENPYIFIISNEKEDGRPIGLAKAGQYWHSDMYFIDRPAHASALLSITVPPEGGDTLVMNMAQVYAALADSVKRRLDGLKILLSYQRAWPHIYPTRAPMSEEDRRSTPDVMHALVQTHPESGRPSLYLGALFSDDNPGVELIGLPYDEGRALYAELRDFALAPRFIYRHRWQVGDLLLMDNRCCMHSGTEWDDARHIRTLYRTTGIGARTGTAVTAGDRG